MSGVGKSNRDRQWSRVRLLEFAYTALVGGLTIGMIVYAMSDNPSDLVFWVVSGAALLAGLGIWTRQYQVLDELGRLRFLKSWAISGMISLTGLTWVLLWGCYEVFQRRAGGDLGFPDMFWPTCVAFFSGPIALGLTNLYLRRQDNREG